MEQIVLQIEKCQLSSTSSVQVLKWKKINQALSTSFVQSKGLDFVNFHCLGALGKAAMLESLWFALLKSQLFYLIME